MGLLMTTRAFTECVAALAAALSLGAPVASAQTMTADTVVINEAKPTNMPCPVPDVLADHELALGCAQDVPAFLKRLKADTACGSMTRYSVDQACAVILYSLDPQFTGELKLPQTVTVRIGQIQPDANGGTIATVIKSNGSEERLTQDRLYELLIPIRLDERVIQHPDSGTGKKSDQRVGLFGRGIRYYPALLVGRGEAARAMTPEATKRHFTMPQQVMQDLSRMASVECQRYWRCS